MKDPKERLFVGLCALAAIWGLAYWAWDPDDGPPVSIQERGISEGQGAPPPVTIAMGQVEASQPAPDLVEPPEPAPAPTRPRVIPPEFEEYVIRAGDTLETIARERWGTRANAGAIAKANPFVDPNQLRVGSIIWIPKDPTNIQGRVEGAVQSPPSTPLPAGVEYTVQKGDTLSQITARFYGKASLMHLILEANPGVKPDTIRVGQTLIIPPKPAGNDRNADAGR